MAKNKAETKISKDEQIGFHKGALSTLAKEREEMQKILSIVEQLMQMHIKALKDLGVDLAASDFDKCKLEETRFFKSNLDLILVEDIKVWQSKEWVEIKDFSNFETYLINLNGNISFISTSISVDLG